MSRICFKNLLKVSIISSYYLYIDVLEFKSQSFPIFSFCSLLVGVCQISSAFFTAWPSHLARLAFAISKWLYLKFLNFDQYIYIFFFFFSFPFILFFYKFKIKHKIKIVVVVVVVA